MITLKHARLWSWRVKVMKNVESKRVVSSSKENDGQTLKIYTPEQQLTVISTLQKCIQNNTTRPYLSEKRLECLKPLFEENPALASLEPLLHINGFGPKLVHRICDSILQESVSGLEQEDEDSLNKKKKTHKMRLPTGLLTPAYISQVKVESVVSIKLGISTVSWARLRTDDGRLDRWDLVDISQWADKKFDIHSVYDLVMSLREDIPNGDLYVLENSNWSNVANVKKPMKYHIQEAMLTTAICSIFNLTDSGQEPVSERINRVYFLRSYTPFRLFSKIIGSERVSAEDIVLNMIAGEPDERFRPINFVDGTADRFLKLNGSMRDSLCQSLLLVISFVELIMLKNPTDLSIISKPLKKKKS